MIWGIVVASPTLPSAGIASDLASQKKKIVEISSSSPGT
jgi:hypothetical protein